MLNLKPVLTQELFVALQNFEIVTLFNKSPEKEAGTIVLGVSGNRIVTRNRSESCMIRFFQSVINFFKGISTNPDKVNALIHKSIVVINGDNMPTAFERMKRIFQLNQHLRSYFNQLGDMFKELAQKYPRLNYFVS